MKRTIKKASLVLGVILVAGLFTSCTKKKAAPIIASNDLAMTTKKVEKMVETRKPLVFITGIDKGDNTFYKSARAYFLEKNYEVVDYAFSMQEIFTWLNSNYQEKNYGEIHIVSHSNPWRGLSMETVINGERVTSETLRKAMTQGVLPTLKNGITNKTKVVFHSCGLGSNEELMKTLKDAFVSNEIPSVIASPFYNIFGGEFADHYLAKPYYVFYPTANSPGMVDLSKEIARKYPEEKDINWYDALNNEKERYIGDVYTYKFNIPVEWEFDYTNSDNDMPTFKIPEEIMDWIAEDEQLSKVMSKYNIPLEKFRWKSYTKNNKLIIKGKTTVLCVLKPLIHPYGDLRHIEPDVNNLRLYALK